MTMNVRMQNLGFGNLVKLDPKYYVETNLQSPIRCVALDACGLTYISYKPTGGEDNPQRQCVQGSIEEVVAKLDKWV